MMRRRSWSCQSTTVPQPPTRSREYPADAPVNAVLVNAAPVNAVSINAVLVNGTVGQRCAGRRLRR